MTTPAPTVTFPTTGTVPKTATKAAVETEINQALEDLHDDIQTRATAASVTALTTTVNGKASQGDLTALAAEIDNLETSLDRAGSNQGGRPGDDPGGFTSQLTGAPATMAAVSGVPVVDSQMGTAIQITGAGIVAARQPVAILAGRIYQARWVFRRIVDSADPLGDAVVLGVQYLWADQSNNGSYSTALNILTAQGLRITEPVTFSLDRPGVDIVLPAGTQYVRHFIQLFGTTVVTRLGWIVFEDITEAYVNDDISAAVTAAENSLQSANQAAVLAASAAGSELLAAGHASAAHVARTGAETAAIASGAPIVTALTGPVPVNGTIEQLKTDAGLQVWEVVAGAWTFRGWVQTPTFPTFDALKNSTASTLGAAGQIVMAGDEPFEVVLTTNLAANTFKTAGSVRLRRHTGCSCAGCLPLAHALRETASALNPVPIDQIDGVLYGAWSNVLYKSLNGGVSWSSVATIATGTGEIKRILPCNDGQVLVLRNNTVLKSTGWPTPSAWTAKVTAPASAQFIEWSLDGNGQKFISADYALPHNNCRYVHISTDAGDTWTEVIDRADTGFFPTQDNQTHWHGVAYDYFADRFWVCAGDLTYKGHYYSDDDGATWSLVALDANIIGNFQATTISTTPHGMVLGSDDGGNNGLARILRTADPADQRVEVIWRWAHREVSIRGFAFKNAYDPISGLTYTAWRTDRSYAKPIITWSDGLSGGIVYEYEGTFTANDQIRNIAAMPDGGLRAWISRAIGDPETITINAVPRGNITPSDEDTGGLRGGQQTGGRAGVAIGPDSLATQFSVAIGSNANAGVTGSMAIGWNSVGGVNGTALGMTAITGEQGVSVGRDAVSGARGVAVGYDSEAAQDTVVIGRQAAGTGASSVVIGTGVTTTQALVVVIGSATSVAQSGVVVGAGAKTQALESVAVGRNADAQGQHTVAMGFEAIARGNRNTVIGRGAQAGTTTADGDNVVIGDLANTPGGNNVVIGKGANTTAGASSVVIGRNATAGGQWATVVGHGASTTTGNAMAIGLNAVGAHSEAVAIGISTTTEISNSVAIGTRDLQIMGNGVKGVVMRSPDGTRYRLNVANGGTLNIAAF